MRNDVATHAGFRDLVDGKRDAVERDRALGRNESGELGWNLDGEAAAVAIGPGGEEAGEAVDVARHDVPAQLVAGLQRPLQIDALPALPGAKRGLAQGLV